MATEGSMEIESGAGNKSTFKRRKYNGPQNKPVAKNGKVDGEALNKKIASLQKQITSVSGVDEVRYKTSALSGSLDNVIGVVGLLNGMVQGDGENQREGDTIICKTLDERLQFEASDASNCIRRIIVWDRQTNGAGPVLADILEDPFTIPYLSPKKWENRKRFQFLKDDYFNVSSPYQPVLLSKMHLELKNRRTHYIANDSSNVGMGSGSLYVVLMSDSAALNHPTFDYYYRLTYNP